MEKRGFILFIAVILLLITPSFSIFILPQKVYSQQTHPLYKKGIEYASEGKFKEAEEQFKKGLGINKADTTSFSCLGLLKDFKDGKINKEYTLFLFKGLNYMYEGKPEEVIGELKKAIQINNNYAKAYNILGIVYAALDQSENAITYFQKAIEKNPKYSEAHYNLAAVYQAKGYDQQAITHYQKAIQGEPNSVEAHINIGNLYASLGQHQQAITHYQKVIEIDPNYASAYYSLGLVYLMSDQYPKSQENLQKAKELYQQKGDSKSVQEVEEYLNRLRLITKSVKTPP